jgi:hypothetical protein
MSDSNAMKLFISYASEDQQIADVLKLTLKAAFRDEIYIIMLSEFATGLNWKGIIEQSISETDVMIVIATGRLKPSHSFTGYEVGAFKQSVFVQPMMTKWKSLRRRMIPFAVLAQVPDTINEFEGINIDQSSLRDVRFEAASLDDNLRRLQSEQRDGRPNSLKFLLDIQGMLDDRDPDVGRHTIAEEQDTIRILTGFSAEMAKQVISLILNREKSSYRPKAKLIIRTGPGGAKLGRHISIADLSIELIGDFSKIFGPCNHATTKHTWQELTANVPFDVSLQWQKALQAVIGSQPTNEYLEDNTIISFDSKQLYRIITSAIVTYYDDTVEYQVYVVGVLHERECGDPHTSLMLHAVEVSLGYRFLFLENSSLFSPEIFAATAPDELMKSTSDMVDYLTLLLLKAEQYQLSNPQNLLLILGNDSVDQIQNNYVIWDQAKNSLYASAKNILSKKDVTNSDRAALIGAVTEFKKQTVDMNRYYTSAVISKLQTILADAAAQFSPASVSADPVNLKVSSESNLALIKRSSLKTAS